MNAIKELWVGTIHLELYDASNLFWVRSNEIGVQSFASVEAAKKSLSEHAEYCDSEDPVMAADYRTVLAAVEQF